MNYELPDFDTLLALHKHDVKALDQVKKEATEALFSTTLESSQRRLRGLQFQIDMELRRSKSPMDGCIKISTMMHESLAELRTQLDQVFDTDLSGVKAVSDLPLEQKALEQKALKQKAQEEKTADILPFSTCR